MEFILRPFVLSDADSITKYANNKKIADNLRNGFHYPYTTEDTLHFLQTCLERDESKSFVRAIEINGEAVGSIGIFCDEDVYCKCAEVGYWLGEPFWGKGIVSRAIAQMSGEAFARYDIIRIYGEPYAYNIGSRRALEKAGFVLEGLKKKSVCKNGIILDSCMYALLK